MSAFNPIADVTGPPHYLPMFSRLRAILPWIGALRAYRFGDYQLALSLAERSFRLDKHSSNYQLAFYGTLLVLNHRSNEAKQTFKQALSAPSGRSAHAEYVKAYVDYYLELIRRGAGAESLWDVARSLPQTRFSRTYLSLPPVPNP
jgi:tetratricopeptide (TPR) repeat protein